MEFGWRESPFVDELAILCPEQTYVPLTYKPQAYPFY